MGRKGFKTWRPQPSRNPLPQIGGDNIGKSSQSKGRAGEIELAHILQAHGYRVEPGCAQSYGEEPDLSGLPGVHMEVKRVERLNISQAMAQAVRDAEKFQDGAPRCFTGGTGRGGW